MELKAGDRGKVESESTNRRPRTGVIKEVVQGAPSPRYRISWDDGHSSLEPLPDDGLPRFPERLGATEPL